MNNSLGRRLTVSPPSRGWTGGIPNYFGSRLWLDSRDSRGTGEAGGWGGGGIPSEAGRDGSVVVWGRHRLRGAPQAARNPTRGRASAGASSANQRRGAGGKAVRPRRPNVYAEFSLGTSRPPSSLKPRRARPDGDGAEVTRQPRASTLTSTLSGRGSSHSARGVFC